MFFGGLLYARDVTFGFSFILDTPTPSVKSSDDIIGDSDDERTDRVKRKVCNCIYMIQTTKWKCYAM